MDSWWNKAGEKEIIAAVEKLAGTMYPYPDAISAQEGKERVVGYKECVFSLNIINNKIINLQQLIKEYFSDNLQTDQTPIGDMRRNQIRKELLEFAHK